MWLNGKTRSIRIKENDIMNADEEFLERRYEERKWYYNIKGFSEEIVAFYRFKKVETISYQCYKRCYPLEIFMKRKCYRQEIEDYIKCLRRSICENSDRIQYD
jgi:hypothetical protein